MSVSANVQITKEGWVKRKQTTQRDPALSSVSSIKTLINRVKELEEETHSRATQLNELSAMAGTVRALVLRMSEDGYSAEKFHLVKPPIISEGKAGGCSEAFKFIKDTFSGLRAEMISSYRIKLQHEKDLASIRRELLLIEELETDLHDLPVHPGFTEENVGGTLRILDEE